MFLSTVHKGSIYIFTDDITGEDGLEWYYNSSMNEVTYGKSVVRIYPASLSDINIVDDSTVKINKSCSIEADIKNYNYNLTKSSYMTLTSDARDNSVSDTSRYATITSYADNMTVISGVSGSAYSANYSSITSYGNGADISSRSDGYSGHDNRATIKSYGNNAILTNITAPNTTGAPLIISEGDNTTINAISYNTGGGHSIISSGRNTDIRLSAWYQQYITEQISLAGGNASISTTLQYSGTATVKVYVTSNNCGVNISNHNSNVVINSGISGSTISTGSGNSTITNNGASSIFLYQGSVAGGSDTFSAWSTNDTLNIVDNSSTVTDVSISGGTKLTIQKGSAYTYLILNGKNRGDKIKVKLGSTNKTYTIGTGLS